MLSSFYLYYFFGRYSKVIHVPLIEVFDKDVVDFPRFPFFLVEPKDFLHFREPSQVKSVLAAVASLSPAAAAMSWWWSHKHRLG